MPKFNTKQPTLSVADISDPEIKGDPQIGHDLFHDQCSGCHGKEAVSGGVMPDLRFSSKQVHDIFGDIVLNGLYEQNGMLNFGERLSKQAVQNIQAYILIRARQASHQRSVGSKKFVHCSYELIVS